MHLNKTNTKQTTEQNGTIKLATNRTHVKYSNIKSRGQHLVVVEVETMSAECEGGKSWISLKCKKN